MITPLPATLPFMAKRRAGTALPGVGDATVEIRLGHPRFAPTENQFASEIELPGDLRCRHHLEFLEIRPHQLRMLSHAGDSEPGRLIRKPPVVPFDLGVERGQVGRCGVPAAAPPDGLVLPVRSADLEQDMPSNVRSVSTSSTSTMVGSTSIPNAGSSTTSPLSLVRVLDKEGHPVEVVDVRVIGPPTMLAELERGPVVGHDHHQ